MGKTREHEWALTGLHQELRGVKGSHGREPESWKERPVVQTPRLSTESKQVNIDSQPKSPNTQGNNHHKQDSAGKNKRQFRLQKRVLSALYEMTEENKSWNDRTGDPRLPQLIRYIQRNQPFPKEKYNY